MTTLTPQASANDYIHSQAAERALEIFSQLLNRTKSGQQTQDRFEQSRHYTGVAYIAIRVIIDALSGAKITVCKKREQQVDSAVLAGDEDTGTTSESQYLPVPDDHPAQELLNHINGQDTQADFLAHWVLQECLTGSFFIWANPNAFGIPVELWPLPSAIVQYLPSSSQYPDGYFRVNWNQVGGWGFASQGWPGLVDIPPEQMLICKTVHPLWRWDGYSPQTAGAIQLDLLNSIDISRKAAMDKGVNLDVVISIDGATKDQLEAVKNKLESKHAGANNARAVAAVDGGRVTLSSLGTPAKDMDYTGNWHDYVSFCLALFNVPDALVMGKDSSYAVLYSSMQQLRETNLTPRLTRYAGFLQKHLIEPIFGDDLIVEIKLPQLKDPTVLQGFFAGNPGGAVTVNEYRALQNLPPLKDGDVTLPEFSQKRMPQPAPGAMPGQPGEQQQPEGKPDGNNLGGMLGGVLPTSPKNEDGKGSKGPQPLNKSIVSGIVAEQLKRLRGGM